MNLGSLRQSGDGLRNDRLVEGSQRALAVAGAFLLAIALNRYLPSLAALVIDGLLTTWWCRISFVLMQLPFSNTSIVLPLSFSGKRSCSHPTWRLSFDRL